LSPEYEMQHVSRPRDRTRGGIALIVMLEMEVTAFESSLKIYFAHAE